MSTNTIKTVKDFSEVVKVAFEMRYPEANVRVQEVQKNNNLILTGLTILEGQANIAPTIYLNSFFEQYKAGRQVADIFEAIDEAYNEHKVECNFNVDQIMSYECVQDKICYKLINKAKNEALLQDVPYVPFMDLAVVFYITVGEFKDALGTILIRNNMLDIWGVDAESLYPVALLNTMHRNKGRVHSMLEVVEDILGSDEEAREFFQMDVLYDDFCPMYVCTNESKINGAGVILYTGLLKAFSERIGGDFYILPSSIHETILLPAVGDMDVSYLLSMVREVNATEVANEEILSDNVYKYLADEDRIVMM